MTLSSRRKPSSRSIIEAPPSANLFGPDKSLGYLIRDVHRAFVRELIRALAKYQISGAQWAALRVLWDEQGITQVQLAERMRTEKAALTAVLNTLERKGLIVRSRDSVDRRKINLHLTRAGEQLKRFLLPISVRVHDRATAGLSAAEQASTRKLLERILANLTRGQDC
jgi:DNA-binding MarR family transcriptional regulator